MSTRKYWVETMLKISKPVLENLAKDELVKKYAAEIYSDLTIHDLRVVPGTTHTNVVFDLVKPHECLISDSEISDMINKKIKDSNSKYNCVIKIEPPFV